MKRTVLSKLSKLLLVAALAGAVAVVVALRGNDSPAPGPPDGGTSTSEVQQDPSGTAGYWTDERMEGAEPAPMPHD